MGFIKCLYSAQKFIFAKFGVSVFWCCSRYMLQFGTSEISYSLNSACQYFGVAVVTCCSSTSCSIYMMTFWKDRRGFFWSIVLVLLLILEKNYFISCDSSVSSGLNQTENCFSACKLACACPLGPNLLVCSGQGKCVNGKCKCHKHYTSSLGNTAKAACDVEIMEMKYATYIVVGVLSSLAILVSVVTSMIYIYFRKDPVMKNLRTVFGHIMNAGVCIGSSAIASVLYFPTIDNEYCELIWWVLDYSFILVYGTLLARMYRNFRIFFYTKNETLKLSDTWVLLVIFIFLIIETIILLLASIFVGFNSDSRPHIIQMDHSYKKLNLCYFGNRHVMYQLVPSKLVLLTSICLLSFKLRNVNVQFNETKPIVIASGVSLLLWLVVSVLYVFVDLDHGDFFYASVSIIVCVPFLITILSILVPKLHLIKKSIKRKRGTSNRFISIASLQKFEINSYLWGVAWTDVNEVEIAEQTLEDEISSVGHSCLKIESILLLLSPDVKHCGIREIAVECLAVIEQSTFLMYLPQFLQAIKYEPSLLAQRNQSKPSAPEYNISDSCLAKTIINRGIHDFEIALQLYWSTIVETLSTEAVLHVENGVPMIIKREKQTKQLYCSFLELFLNQLNESGGANLSKSILLQSNFIDLIKVVYTEVCNSGGDVKSKLKYFKDKFNSTDASDAFKSLREVKNSLSHPLYPKIMIREIDAENCSIFRSSAKPLKLAFRIDELAQRKVVQSVLQRKVSQSIYKNDSPLMYSESNESIDEHEDQCVYDINITVIQAKNLSPMDLLQNDREITCSINSTDKDYISESESGDEYRKMEQFDLKKLMKPYVKVECNSYVMKTGFATSENNIYKWGDKIHFCMGTSPHIIEFYIFNEEENHFNGKRKKDRRIGHCIFSTDLIQSHVKGSEIKHQRNCLKWIPLESSNGELEVEINISAKNLLFEIDSLREKMDKSVNASMHSVLNFSKTGVIYKVGDDLRQDQLATQLLVIFDKLLKSHDLDLRLSPYRVLATSPKEGFVEFVEDAYTLSYVLEDNHHDILGFLRKFNYDLDAVDEISHTAIENYLRSCAGYCVITYILGIGDRHLDNLMLKKSGHFFHIDFGFMFGKDPKPFPPMFRLTSEMVAAMGGINGKNFKTFCRYATHCFQIIRENSNVILGVLKLMQDASIPDLQCSPDRALSEVEERLLLDANDSQAASFMNEIILNSQNSKTITKLTIMEQFHKIAVSRQ